MDQGAKILEWIKAQQNCRNFDFANKEQAPEMYMPRSCHTVAVAATRCCCCAEFVLLNEFLNQDARTK